MKKTTIVLAFILLLTSGIAQATPFSNGSFESASINPGTFTTLSNSTVITDWVVGNSGSIDYIGSYWQAAAGNRSIDMDGNYPGSISQTFDTVANQTYKVTFFMAGNPDGAAYGVGPIKTLGALITGNPLQTFTFDSTGKSEGNMGWLEKSFTFEAAGNSTTLTFESLDSDLGGAFPLGAFGPALDNVSVNPVPEPGTFVLLGAGMLGLAIFGKRRSNKKEA